MLRQEEVGMTELKFSVPALAPSGNHYVKHAGGRHYRSQPAIRWDSTVAAFVQGRFVMADYYHIEIDFTVKDKKRKDIDNLTKCSLDALCHCGAIGDDSRVMVLILRKHFGAEERTDFTIRDMGLTEDNPNSFQQEVFAVEF